MGSYEYQNEEGQERAVTQEGIEKKIVSEFLKPLEGVGDEMELNLHITDHNSGGQTTHKFRVGDWKRQVKEGIENLSKDDKDGLFVQWGKGQGVDLLYHDYYSIEVVTPEVRAEEERMAEISYDINELEKLGVKREVFFEYDQMGESSMKFIPADIARFGKIIEEYLSQKDKK